MAEQPTLTSLANIRELEYRDRVQPRHDSPATMLAKIRSSGRLRILPYLHSAGILRPFGQILEIGAGSGWLSAELSKLPSVTRVVAVDFSQWLVEDVMPEVQRALEARMDKIERVRGDFHDLSFLRGRPFDFVFADSALHHATDVSRVLSEAASLLQPEGRIVAVREPVRPVLAGRVVHSRAAVERALQEHGVHEPLYSRAEWRRFFEGAGLTLRMEHVVFSGGIRGRLARALNGVTKADYCLIGARRGASLPS